MWVMDFGFWASSVRLISCILDEISSLTTDVTAPVGIPELLVVWKSVLNAPPTSFWCEKAK